MAVFALIYRASRNILGEFSRLEDAESLRAELIAADPSVSDDLIIHKVEDARAPESTSVAHVN